MKNFITVLFIFIVSVANGANLFYYSPKDGKGGLRFAVENKDGIWHEIGDKFNFVSSDFGSWGSGKKMYDPVLVKTAGGWNLYFTVIPGSPVVAVTETNDFIHWKPQEYFNRDRIDLSGVDLNPYNTVNIRIGNEELTGRIIETDDKTIERLEAYVKEKGKLKQLYSERTDSDSYRFKGIDKVKANLTVTEETKEISPLLMGIFFEDINYAADGGLYAELIQNRDFEYTPGESRDKKWGHDYAWEIIGDNLDMEIKTENPLSINNPHYVKLTLQGELQPDTEKTGLYNTGFDGISLKKGEYYRFTLRARSHKDIPLMVELTDSLNRPIAKADLNVEGNNEWNEYKGILRSGGNYRGAKLRVVPKIAGSVDLDMISLFPVNTFKGRENGLRPDLAQTLADLKPKFVRFPGGCVAHGNGIDNIYDWKGSVGALEDRKPLYNIWNYHQTRGLGYHEYFLFCEDIGAEPLPVLAAGVPCQNSSRESRFTTDDLTRHGQQQGIPMDSMAAYVQDILDLIEYANGPADSEWGAKRAAAGHPEPFNLKYIGIGNEDMITDVFKQRFTMIKDAVKEAYPEIFVVGTTGPFYEGSDYDEGWRFAKEQNLDMVDEHYYVEPGWLIYNQDFYDEYDREGPKVYLGEWAAHLPDRSSTMETALAEALYITSLERNGDIVSMSSYAPLLAKKNHTQWRPDLIYFDNDSVYPTTDYHVMRLAGENSGDRYFINRLNVDSDNDKVKSRIGASVVSDSKTGETYIKLVNLLPVETIMDLNLESLMKDSMNSGETYTLTTMKGSPDQTNPDISVSVQTFNKKDPEITLPPYSFTVIKF